MKYILPLLLLYSCSQVSINKDSTLDDEVSVQSALNHIRISYMKGCVDTFKELQLPISFELCRDKAQIHEKEVRALMDIVP